MGAFVFNWEQMYDEYRGDLRKRKLEDKTPGPARLALNAKYPNLLGQQIEVMETKQRHTDWLAPHKTKCHRCHGEDYIPVRLNYPPAKLPPGFDHYPEQVVPCALCQKISNEIWQKTAEEVKKEVWGE